MEFEYEAEDPTERGGAERSTFTALSKTVDKSNPDSSSSNKDPLGSLKTHRNRKRNSSQEMADFEYAPLRG